MSNIKPGAQDVMQCADAFHESCSATAAGHAISALQERVAAATPRKWRDGVVSSVTSDGWIGIELLASGETAWVWNHSAAAIGAATIGAERAISVGQPVALHALYNVLALGSERISVLVAAAID